MVRVLAVADEEVLGVRSRLRDLDVDLVIGAGDLQWDYLVSIRSALDVPGVFVPGNHDPRTGPGHTGPAGFVNADGRVVEVGGLRIAGLGGCVRYNAGPHQYTQKEYDARAKQLLRSARRAGPVDVLLTHAPPLGLGDEPDPSHLGISALHGVLAELEPTWHLHGHVHPFGMLKADRSVGRTTVRNVIPWDVLEIEPRSVVPVSTRSRRSA
ncbi:metallophosphoesterase family protein [Aeromicrobium yanjiei]|uniref:Metallophosphoesterase n=1 Tax=Aeromicrobium yanjiei TaxID=2662028 RepID=A0A5Q2MIE9_9ACTN|nr:metallophosphoesterase [Aeromicrobium yanjiei]QGG40822.1 metallophosphoesterase [Aeromicrobium yanjiei]